MAKKTQDNETLPAVVGESFDLTISNGGAVPMNPDLAEELGAEDFEGYDASRAALPIVSIRQRPLVNDNGKTLFEPGGFGMYDPVTADSNQVIADQETLAVTILADQPSRVYWPEGDFGKPHCRSNDGKVGVGKPGGNCDVCPLAQWSEDKRPPCTAQMNCLVYDHGNQLCYVLRLGRSGLRPYGNFKEFVKRLANRQPLHTFRVTVSTRYEKEPAPHYIPVFTVERQIDIELFRALKQIRAEYTAVLGRTVEVDTVDEEHPQHDDDLDYEKPPENVTPINDSDGDEDLPF